MQALSDHLKECCHEINLVKIYAMRARINRMKGICPVKVVSGGKETSSLKGLKMNQDPKGSAADDISQAPPCPNKIVSPQERNKTMDVMPINEEPGIAPSSLPTRFSVTKAESKPVLDEEETPEGEVPEENESEDVDTDIEDEGESFENSEANEQGNAEILQTQAKSKDFDADQEQRVSRSEEHIIGSVVSQSGDLRTCSEHGMGGRVSFIA
ncbi:hypothetical protein U1Q18_014568 [Sarracenia purpurea var. burkii]